MKTPYAVFLFATISIAFLIQPIFGQAGAAPLVRTNPASTSDFKADSAILNGFIDSQGHFGETAFWFEWGQSILLGFSTIHQQRYDDFAISFSNKINLPNPDVAYFFRAVAQNSSGITYGKTLSFRVLKRPLNKPVVINQGAETLKTQSPEEIQTAETGLSDQVEQNISVGKNILIEQEISNLSFPNGTNLIISAKYQDSLEISFKITNKEKATLKNLILKNNFSPFLEFIETKEKSAYDQQKNEVSFTIKELKKNETKIFKIQTRAKEFSENIVLENFGVLQWQDLLIKSNKTTILLNAAPISFSLKTDSLNAAIGETISYRLDYKNQAKTDLKDVSLKIVLAKGIEFKESDKRFSKKGNILSLEIGDLEPKEEGFIIFKVLATEEAKIKEPIIVSAFVNYKDIFSAEQKEISSSATIVLKRGGLATASSAGTAGFLTENIFSFGLLNLSILISLLIILGGVIWYFQDICRKNKEELQKLSQKISGQNTNNFR